MKKKSATEISSLDADGSRLYLQPAEVKGFFRRWRTVVQVFLMLVLVITPWTTINGYQTVLLNIPNREFYFFGFFLRAHNLPLFFFLLFGIILFVIFVTMVWGRIWCGWACPQTVFIDGVYRRIELWVEGNYLARRKMQTDPLSAVWLFKKSFKWLLFIIVSSIIAHSLLSYFLGAHEFYGIILNGPAHSYTVFLIAQLVTLGLLFDFGWFREQFCTVMCPYGRFQGLLLQKNTLAVVYDEKRSDCINCSRCVSACPIGIDIRNGLQMECIACTACIDACDEIMEKVQKPKGLVRYDTLDRKKINYKNPRIVLLLLGSIGCLLFFAISLQNKMHSEAFLLRAQEAPFQQIRESGSDTILNHFKLHITNQDQVEHVYQVLLPNNQYELISASQTMKIKPKEFKEWHIFIKQSLKSYKGRSKIEVIIQDAEVFKNFNKKFEIDFMGPVL